MSANRYSQFFKIATGGECDPYPYQERLAGSDEGRSHCESLLIDIPTGMGKTAAVTIAWLWNRVVLKNPNWPRRLVYCLPMRTLVEQTRDEVGKWLEAAWLEYTSDEIKWLKENSPVVLMGGERSENDQAEWDLHPEREAILIGTQDMLLSRALNRGYGMSRFRWPMHFGLLNNDCLWVLDETQLMGVGIETTSQLEGLRQDGKLGTHLTSKTWWMSATLDEAQLATVDHPVIQSGLEKCGLAEDERNSDGVRKKLTAEKRLHLHEITLSDDKKDDVVAYTKAIAESLNELHETDTLTLAVFNRVERAQMVYEALAALKPDADIALIHSRFRAGDRAEQQRILESSKNRIVVATQAIEAGVDVSARVLITELAPWSSVVQRFGRCHRYGEIAAGADIYWIDIHSDDEKKNHSLALPYEPEELKESRAALASLESANATGLEGISISPPKIIRPVIRRKDLLDLADTTSDLAGNDLDISRYVRDGDDTDVQIFWREVEGESEPSKDSHPAPHRDELCRVSIYQFQKFLPKEKEKRRVWRWDHLDETWTQVSRAIPGQIYLVDLVMGGYSPELGWTKDKKHMPTLLPGAKDSPQAYDGDLLSRLGVWVTLADHTRNVCRELDSILKVVNLPDDESEILRTAALWHDAGKAHPVFQGAISAEENGEHDDEIWAKAKSMSRYDRKHFRHELASALIWLQSRNASEETADSTRLGDRSNSVASEAQPYSTGTASDNLIAYLIAAHHGKVRFSIRALPGETEPKEEDAVEFFARGLWHGDRVPGKPTDEIVIGDLRVPATALDLSLMRLGNGSWLERMIGLLESPELGPFRLGYLETLLRSADMRASAEEAKKGGTDE